MRKGLLLFSLLAVLAMPVMAAPRDDDPRGVGRDVVKRVVFLLKRLFHAFDDPIVVGPPKP